MPRWMRFWRFLFTLHKGLSYEVNVGTTISNQNLIATVVLELCVEKISTYEKSQSPDTVFKIWGSLHSKIIWARLIFRCKFCSPSKLSLPYERTFLIHWAKFFLVPYLCKKFACEWKKELFQSLHRLKSSVNHIIKSRTNSILYSFLYSNRGKYNWINPFSK